MQQQTTTVHDRLAAFLAREDASPDGGKSLQASFYLYGLGSPDKVPQPLGNTLHDVASGAVAFLAIPGMDIPGGVQAIILRAISLGYAFREEEYQRQVQEG